MESHPAIQQEAVNTTVGGNYRVGKISFISVGKIFLCTFAPKHGHFEKNIDLHICFGSMVDAVRTLRQDTGKHIGRGQR